MFYLFLCFSSVINPSETAPLLPASHHESSSSLAPATRTATTMLQLTNIGIDDEAFCGYRGVGITFTRVSQGDWIWRCKAAFVPRKSDGTIRNVGTLSYPRVFASKIKMLYEFNIRHEQEMTSETGLFTDRNKPLDYDGIYFSYSHVNARQGDRLNRTFTGSHLLGWKTDQIEHVIDAVTLMEGYTRNTSTNKLPPYTLAGYGVLRDAINCCGFATQVLKDLGINVPPHLDLYTYDSSRAYRSGWWARMKGIFIYLTPLIYNQFIMRREYLAPYCVLSPELMLKWLIQNGSSELIYPENIIGGYGSKLRVLAPPLYRQLLEANNRKKTDGTVDML